MANIKAFRRSPVAVAITISLLLGATGVALGVVNLTRSSGNAGVAGSHAPVALVTVPNLIGMTVAAAAGDLQASGLYNSIDNLNCGRDVGKGLVAAESPPPGSTVDRGTRISLQVSCSTPT